MTRSRPSFSPPTPPAGCCPTWGHLTTVWATDSGYGLKVMVIYSSMVDHALDRRARGEGFEAPH